MSHNDLEQITNSNLRKAGNSVLQNALQTTKSIPLETTNAARR
jgi:hypothetical protein